MNLVFFKLSGEPKPGDYLNLCYRSKHGGRTDAQVWIGMNLDGTVPNCNDIASWIANKIREDWKMVGFEAKAKEGTIILTHNLSDVEFEFEQEGSRGIQCGREDI